MTYIPVKHIKDGAVYYSTRHLERFTALQAKRRARVDKLTSNEITVLTMTKKKGNK